MNQNKQGDISGFSRALLADLERRALSADDVSGFLFELAHEVRDRLGAASVRIACGSDDELVEVATSVGDQAAGRAGGAAVEGGSLEARAARVDHAVQEHTVSAPGLPAQAGPHSGVAVPVPGPLGPAGALSVYAPASRTWPQGDIVVLQGAANAAATALGQRELRHRARRQAHLLDAIEAAVVATDADGVVTEWNRAAEQIFGVAAGDALGAPWDRVVPAAHPEVVDEVKSALGAGRRWEGEFMVRRGTRTVPLHVTDSPIFDSGGGIAGTVCVAVDITEHKRFEEELTRARHGESVARLAAGLAHDFGNLLGVVQGYAHLLVEDLKKGEAGRDHADEIVRAAKRAKILIRRLLALPAGDSVRPEVVNCNDVVRDLSGLVKGVVASDVEIRMRLAERLWAIEIDPAQLEQALMNLLFNARDAMPGGGEIVISTSNARFDEHDVRDFPGAVPGPYVRVELADSGQGMAPEILERAFDPFFTTKAKGKGTGLGLAMVFALVKQAGGYVYGWSEEGRGSRFTLYLPAYDAGPDEVDLTAPELMDPRLDPPPAGGLSEIILPH